MKTFIWIGLIISAGLWGVPLRGGDLECEGWEWLEPDLQGNFIADLAWNGNVFVAVGGAGTVLTSPDGLKWTRAHIGGPEQIWRLLWSGSQFLAVGSMGAFYTSSDGSNWERQASGQFTNTFTDIDFNGSQYMAAGEGLAASVDGIQWLGVSGLAARGVAWTGNQWVAVGDNLVARSADGGSWTSDFIFDWFLQDVAFNGALMVAVGSKGAQGLILTSNDGVNWTEQVFPLNRFFHRVEWLDGQFVVTGHQSLLISTNGQNWVETHQTDEILYGMASDGGRILVGGEAGRLLFSPNGQFWTPLTEPAQFHHVTRHGDRYVAVGEDGLIMTSEDGQTWETRSSSVSHNLYRIISTGDRLIALGGNASPPGNVVITSSDGLVWTPQTTPTGLSLQALAWNGSIFVAVGAFGAMMTSTDGENWTDRGVMANGHFSDVAWNGSFFTAVGKSGPFNYILLTSPDGFIWTSRLLESPCNGIRLNSVTAGNGLVVAAAEEHFIITSEDGENWNCMKLPLDLTFNRMAWSGSYFYIMGHFGEYWLTSSDGEHWAAIPSPMAVSRSLLGDQDQTLLVGTGIMAGFCRDCFTNDDLLNAYINWNQGVTMMDLVTILNGQCPPAS